jgi:hypothetical protein
MYQSEEQQAGLAHGLIEIRSEILYQRTVEIKHIPDHQLNVRDRGGDMPYRIIRSGKAPLPPPSCKTPDHRVQQAQQHQPSEYGMKE